ncbi:MAG: glycosyltransferase family 4 protein [Acidobacteria bacterium]|nr:glycosyltransferase family 4 protein [Acidobacteriota bacterium]
MRIAVDARALEERPTGTGRYLIGILREWLAAFPGDHLSLLSCRPVHLPDDLGSCPGLSVAIGGRRMPGTLWLQTLAPRMARLAEAEAFFGPLGVLPRRPGLPSVVTIHDLTPVLFPEWHTRKNRLAFGPFLPGTLAAATAVIAVSRATRRDLVARHPEAERKTVVVWNGVDAVRPPPLTELPEPYVLFLGTLEPRKNVDRLVAAMESIWDRRPDFPKLLLAGGSGWGLPKFEERLRGSRHAARIERLGYVPAGNAEALIAGARVLAYPSLYEGFGLPVLEAMALGTVVVGSSASSLPEVIGEAGLLPDPTSVADIAAAIEKAQDDEAFRAEARVLGLARAATFTWKRAALETRAVFERVRSPEGAEPRRYALAAP